MKFNSRKYLLLLFLLVDNLLLAQIEENVHNLSSQIEDISPLVKNIISKNIAGKQFVFLGESFHKSGGDLRSKTDFVKFLVEEEGYKDIIFESDFYALYNEHSKENIYGIWSQSEQCQELFTFLDKERVTMWGMDNKFHTQFSKSRFPIEFQKKLKNEEIAFTSKYMSIVDKVLKLEFELKDQLGKDDLEYFDMETQRILNALNHTKERFWFQAIQNLKSCSLIYREKNVQLSIAERATQMAENLNFLGNYYPNKKFIVWAANAHIAKTTNDYMGETTMGVEFLKKNSNKSYHIAFGSIKMPYRKIKRIQRKRKSSNNLLHYLPDIDNDYFMDTKQIKHLSPTTANKSFYANLWSAGRRHLITEWIQHFDAIVFIEKGELSRYKKKND